MTEEAAEKVSSDGRKPQGLEPSTHSQHVAARLKSCPDAYPSRMRVRQQHVKSCPDTNLIQSGRQTSFQQPVGPGFEGQGRADRRSPGLGFPQL